MTPNFEFIKKSKEFSNKEKIITYIEEIENFGITNSDWPIKDSCCAKLINFRYLLEDVILLCKMYWSDTKKYGQTYLNKCKAYEEENCKKFKAQKYDQNEQQAWFSTTKDFFYHEFKINIQDYTFNIKKISIKGAHRINYEIDKIGYCKEIKSVYSLLILILEKLNLLNLSNKNQFSYDVYGIHFDNSFNHSNNEQQINIDKTQYPTDITSIYALIKKIFSDSKPKIKLFVPNYQREYVWGEKQIKILIEDIIKCSRKICNDHYLGSLLFCKHNDGWFIIDGQQRIITSIIFLKKMKDLFKDTNKERFNELNFIDNIQIDFFNNSAKSSFEDILKDTIHNKVSNNKFVEALNIFDKELNNDLNLEDIYETFTKHFFVSHVIFQNLSKKDELSIFESINSKGLRLDPLDIIRLTLANRCSDKTLLDNGDEIELMFQRIFVKPISPRNWYRDETLSRKTINRTILDFFKTLICYFVGKAPMIDTNDTGNYQNFISELNDTIDKIFEFKKYQKSEYKKDFDLQMFNKMISFLKEYYDWFISIKQRIDNSRKIEVIIFNEINSLIHESGTSKRPLYLMWYMVKDILDVNIEDFFRKTSNFTIKSIINEMFEFVKVLIHINLVISSENSSFSKKFYEEVSRSISCIKEYPNIEMIKRTIKDLINKYNLIGDNWKKQLKSIQAIRWEHKSLLTIIRWLLEKHFETLGDYGCNVDYIEPSWEHFMPIEYEKHWKDDIKKWNNINDDLELNIEVQNHIHSIGNAIQLPIKTNSKSQNKSFFEKKKEYDSLGYPAVLYSNSTNINIDISKKTQWSFNDIKKREDALINFIQENIFKYN